MPAADIDEEDIEYAVVLNDEEQYSIWPTGRPLPPGWREDGTRGPKRDCLAHIGEVWTDMRPRSSRERERNT
jgi:MbtH protein